MTPETEQQLRCNDTMLGSLFHTAQTISTQMAVPNEVKLLLLGNLRHCMDYICGIVMKLYDCDNGQAAGYEAQLRRGTEEVKEMVRKLNGEVTVYDFSDDKIKNLGQIPPAVFAEMQAVAAGYREEVATFVLHGLVEGYFIAEKKKT